MNSSEQNGSSRLVRYRCDRLHRSPRPSDRRRRSNWQLAASASLCLLLSERPTASPASAAEIHLAATSSSSIDGAQSNGNRTDASTSHTTSGTAVPQQQSVWQLSVFSTRAGRVDWRCTPFIAAENRHSTRDAEITVRLLAAHGVASRGGLLSARTDVAAGRESAVVSLWLEGHGTGVALVSVTMLGHADEIAADRYSSDISVQSTAH